jgi:glucose-1-phosphate thymidylyltransferase
MSDSSLQVNALLLAAGYGTRLKKIGEKIPKGLFKNVSNLSITDMMLAQLGKQPEIKQIALVSNQRFFDQYQHFIQQNYPKLNVKILSDGTTEPKKRLGSLGDLIFSLNKLNWWQNDLLVLPSDRNPNQIIPSLIKLRQQYGPEVFYTTVVKLPKEKIANRSGCAQLNKQNQIIAFEEKPAKPKSNWAALPFYFFTPRALKLLKKYQQTGHSLDSPGNIIPWLLKNKLPIQAYLSHQDFIDIGNLAQLQAFQQMK